MDVLRPPLERSRDAAARAAEVRTAVSRLVDESRLRLALSDDLLQGRGDRRRWPAAER